MNSGTIETETTELSRILEYVNQISLELATIPQGQDIYSLITKKLMDATGAIGVTFGDYDSDEQEVVLKHLETDSNLLNIANKVLGYSLMNVKASVTEEMYNNMVTKQVSYRANLTEATFGEISPTVSTLFMKTLNIGYFEGMAYVVEGKLYGTSVLAFKSNFPVPSTHLLKTLCNVIAVALSRHKTEIDLRHSIKALQISEERFRNIAEQLRDAIFLTDSRGTILYLSPSTKQLFGYEPGEMLGKNFILYLHKSDLKKALSRFQMAINISESREPLILRMIRKNGEEFFGELVSSNVHEDGRVSGTIGLIRDISERIKAETEIKSLNADLETRVQNRTVELKEANKELEAFCYSISHDLRSPLRTISGFSSILIEDNHHQLNEEGKVNLNRIVNATQYMGQLIDDLLNLSRLYKAGIHAVDVDISKLVRSEFDSLIMMEPDREIELDIQDNIIVRADKNLIHNAIQNLVNNAWKFTSTQKKAKITLGTTIKDNQTIYFLKDNGVGFDMNYYHKLFHPFQRLHGRNDFPGTGIGLASVKRIINKHNGEIWAESQPGKGATFYFSLGT